ncbi:MAG: glutamate--tRNA ligase family protein [Terracidiphilus sp.]|jgi:glutamyl-tRNA synthetase
MATHSPSLASSYRGRLAPSPTGYLHVGHARTFWTAYQRAEAARGTLVIRMEDLDPERSRAIYSEAAMEDLRWLGINWQEGPDLGGPYAPYEQSGRRVIYLEAWRKLLRGGFLFPCRCSRKDLEAALSAPHEGASTGGHNSKSDAELDQLDDEPVYPGTCRKLATNILEPPDSATNEIIEPDGYNWRFRVPDGEAIEFVDGNLGPQRYVAGVDFGDFVVLRRDGIPSYQLACVVDDAAMKITEVVRGEDLLKSTARQILLYRALGLEIPNWFHCRLVVDSNGRRLAKRHDALSLRNLHQRGVTPAEILSAKGRKLEAPNF